MDEYFYEWPTDSVGNALVQAPGVLATPSTSSWSWLSSLFQPAASVANTYITQRGLTERQQQAINAGQVTLTANQGTIFGIPTSMVLIGGLIFLMVKK